MLRERDFIPWNFAELRETASFVIYINFSTMSGGKINFEQNGNYLYRMDIYLCGGLYLIGIILNIKFAFTCQLKLILLDIFIISNHISTFFRQE